MQELKDNRTLNTKLFKKDDNTYLLRSHAGIPHYYNDRGVGDGEVRWRKIDKTLSRGFVSESIDDITLYPSESFYYDYANDASRFPIYADGLIRTTDYFNGRSYTTSWIPQCNHVTGSIVSGSGLEYIDAFGNGIDLLIQPTKTKVNKLVSLNKFESKDYDFEFEIIIENYTSKGLKIFRVLESDPTDYYEIKLASLAVEPKVFDNPNRITIIGKTPTDGTIIYPPKSWYKIGRNGIDDEESTYIETTLRGDYSNPTSPKFYLTKHIKQDFVDSAIRDNAYILQTDTSIGVSNGSYDGALQHVQTGSTSKAKILVSQQATTATNQNTTAINNWAYCITRGCSSTSNTAIYRQYFIFDTSTIPDNATIIAASLDTTVRRCTLHGNQYYYNITVNGGDGGHSDVRVALHEFKPDDYDAVDLDDYDETKWSNRISDILEHTEFATDNTLPTSDLNLDYTWTITDTSIINTSGKTGIGTRVDADWDSQNKYTYSWCLARGLLLYTEENMIGQTFLDVTFTLPFFNKFNGLNHNNIQSINEIPVTNVKFEY